jgi:hypothetical protein
MKSNWYVLVRKTDNRPLVSERKCENLAGNLVELVGIEPTTSSLRTMRSPS